MKFSVILLTLALMWVSTEAEAKCKNCHRSSKHSHSQNYSSCGQRGGCGLFGWGRCLLGGCGTQQSGNGCGSSGCGGQQAYGNGCGPGGCGQQPQFMSQGQGGQPFSGMPTPGPRPAGIPPVTDPNPNMVMVDGAEVGSLQFNKMVDGKVASTHRIYSHGGHLAASDGQNWFAIPKNIADAVLDKHAVFFQDKCRPKYTDDKCDMSANLLATNGRFSPSIDVLGADGKPIAGTHGTGETGGRALASAKKTPGERAKEMLNEGRIPTDKDRQEFFGSDTRRAVKTFCRKLTGSEEPVERWALLTWADVPGKTDSPKRFFMDLLPAQGSDTPEMSASDYTTWAMLNPQTAGAKKDMLSGTLNDQTARGASVPLEFDLVLSEDLDKNRRWVFRAGHGTSKDGKKEELFCNTKAEDFKGPAEKIADATP